MKLTCFLIVLLYTSVASSQIWNSLGSTDAERLATTELIVDRLIGVTTGDSCVGYYFNFIQDSFRTDMISFLCTWWGGNPESATTRLPECQWLNNGSTIYSSDTADLLTSLTEIAAPWRISVEEYTVYKNYFNAVVDSIFTDATLTNNIVLSIGNELDNAIEAFDGTVSRPCVAETDIFAIPWLSGVYATFSIVFGKTVCWKWGDDNPHSVAEQLNLTSENFVTAYGSGDNALTINSFCNNYTDATPCFLQGYTPRYCHTFLEPGYFLFMSKNETQLIAHVNVGSPPPPPPPPVGPINIDPSTTSSSDSSSSEQTNSDNDVPDQSATPADYSFDSASYLFTWMSLMKY